MEITPQSFGEVMIDAFTARDESKGAMPVEELFQRLDIGLETLKEPQGTVTAKDAANCLRGALIRLAQAYGDPRVSAKVDEFVKLTIQHTGI